MVDWIESSVVGVPVTWYTQEMTMEVNDEKELLRTIVTAVTNGAVSRIYVDVFKLLRDLERDLIEGDKITYVLVPEQVGNYERAVWGATKDVQVNHVYLVPRANVIGNDLNYTQLSIKRKDSEAILCTKTFIAGIDAPAYTVTSFGPVNTAAGALSTNVGLSLLKEDSGDGMLLPEMVLIIEWNLR